MYLAGDVSPLLWQYVAQCQTSVFIRQTLPVTSFNMKLFKPLSLL